MTGHEAIPTTTGVRFLRERGFFVEISPTVLTEQLAATPVDVGVTSP
jgi:hypothetical protein